MVGWVAGWGKERSWDRRRDRVNGKEGGREGGGREGGQRDGELEGGGHWRQSRPSQKGDRARGAGGSPIGELGNFKGTCE